MTWRAPLVLDGFQEEAVVKFQDTLACQILDEMGTGKTVMATERDRRIRLTAGQGAKTLVVSLNGAMVDVWEEHFRWIQPHLKVVKVNPKARGISWREFEFGGGDVLIVHWEAVQLMQSEFLGTIHWRHVIADEVQRICNRKNKCTVALKKIPTVWKTALTGTPSGGNPADWWSILNWLYPKGPDGLTATEAGYFRSYWKFFERFTDSEIMYPQGYRKVSGPKNERQLQQLVEPFTIRRLKKDVMPWLPVLKPPQYRYVDMTPQQRKAYEQMKQDMIAWVEQQEADAEGDIMNPIIAEAAIARLVRLQQFACAYATIDPETNEVTLTEPSSKLDEVMNVIGEMNGKPLVIFSSFKQPLTLLEARLEKAKIDYVKITGDVDSRDRIDAVNKFQTGKVPVFLGTIRAGGEGITLTASSTVCLISRDWNPTRNQQAFSRVHRRGQTEQVNIIDIITRDTVEGEKLETVQMKWSSIKKLLGDDKEKGPFT